MTNDKMTNKFIFATSHKRSTNMLSSQVNFLLQNIVKSSSSIIIRASTYFHLSPVAIVATRSNFALMQAPDNICCFIFSSISFYFFSSSLFLLNDGY